MTAKKVGKTKKFTQRVRKSKGIPHRVRKYKNELCFLGTCNKNQRCQFAKIAPKGVFEAVGDIANTALQGGLNLKEKDKVKLRPHIATLKKLSRRTQSLTSKRRLLASQKGGSILGTLWNVVKNIFTS